MTAYRVEVEVTTKWILEVHAENEQEAAQKASNMDLDEIEVIGDAGGFQVVVGEIEQAYEEVDEDDV